MNWRKKKINPKKHYVVDLSILDKPELFRNEFNFKKAAILAIQEHLGYDFKNYQPILGSEALKHNIPLKLYKKHGNYSIKVPKYKYPPGRVTRQDRKTYRTIMRRRINKLKQK